MRESRRPWVVTRFGTWPMAKAWEKMGVRAFHFFSTESKTDLTQITPSFLVGACLTDLACAISATFAVVPRFRPCEGVVSADQRRFGRSQQRMSIL
jgi:hypothetical protein